jgi:hypothetical protein
VSELAKVVLRNVRRDVELAGPAQQLAFPRPGWHYAAVVSMLPMTLFGAPALLRHTRARWDDRDLVIETWPRQRALRVARADVIDVRCTDTVLGVHVAGARLVPLVSSRRVLARDVERARDLAARLGVPFVDDTGRTTLPPARVV